MATLFVQFELPGIGLVTMQGAGPWSVMEHSGHSQDIAEANGSVSNPTVRSKLRNSANVVFSRREHADAVVAAANAIFAAAA